MERPIKREGRSVVGAGGVLRPLKPQTGRVASILEVCIDFVDRCLLNARGHRMSTDWTRFAWSQPESIPGWSSSNYSPDGYNRNNVAISHDRCSIPANDNRPSDRRPIIASTSTWWCTDIWLSLGPIYASYACLLWLSSIFSFSNNWR